jgi:hypothetical protein
LDQPYGIEEILQTDTEERNILQTIKEGRLTGFVTSCLLNHVIEGKIEGKMAVTERRERRREQLPDDLKEKGGY